MSPNRIAIVTLIADLVAGNCRTLTGLVHVTGLHRETLMTWIRLLKRRKLIRIGEWHRCGSKNVPMAAYEWCTEDGPVIDVKKPSRFTGKERQQRHRTKMKDIKDKEVLLEKFLKTTESDERTYI